MVVENGRGYVPASEHSSGEHEIGIIPIDAVYSPIARVRYQVEETRVGQKTNYDKLTMEIWSSSAVRGTAMLPVPTTVTSSASIACGTSGSSYIDRLSQGANTRAPGELGTGFFHSDPME